uniref:Phosphocholine cytidylyltransferase family protein n=1 Tax=Geoglobus ahangari TaxID=113653 RepID=A0A7C3UDQ6_9EURY
MRAVILAAGMGSRLKPITERIPKALINLGGKPLIAHLIENLIDHGIRDIIIVTGYKSYKIRRFITENYPEINVEFVHNKRYDETNNIYSLHLAIRGLKDPYYILNSDIVYHPKIFTRLHECEKENLTILVDLREDLGKEEMKVVIEGDRVVKIGKKIDPKEAHGEYIGITKVTENSVEELKNVISNTISTHGKGVFYEHAFQKLIDNGGVINYTSTGGLPWTEIDDMDDLIYAKRVVYPKIISK